MIKRRSFVLGSIAPLLAVLVALILSVFALRASWAQSVAVAQGAHTQTAQNTPTPPATEAPSWIILDTLPVTATQADYGAEIYRLVCKSCHGDRGQGLTADWIAQWPPDDQNCWQAKCHHEFIHPQDGFALPHFVPAVIGPNELARFETALDLYDYTRRTMPWHVPGTMLDREYWQVTAYLLRENGIDEGIEPLDDERAASLRLYPAASVSQAPAATVAAVAPQDPETAPAQSTASPSRNLLLILAGAALLAIVSVIILVVGRK